MLCREHKNSLAISVCMGVYNIAALHEFDRAISSILEQDFTDFECLICDDGSTDNTWERLQILAKDDQRIRLFRNPHNLGLAAALNHCIEYARTPIIVRHDADDYSSPDRFRKQYEFLQKTQDIDFVGSDVALYDERGIYGYRRFPIKPQPNDFLFTVPFLHGALMFRKEAIQAVQGYRVARETRRTEDYDLLMRMYAKGLRGANLPETLYYFLENRKAQSRRKYRYRIDEMLVRYQGFRRMGILPKGIPFIFKPLVVGLIPRRLLLRLKRARPY